MWCMCWCRSTDFMFRFALGGVRRCKKRVNFETRSHSTHFKCWRWPYQIWPYDWILMIQNRFFAVEFFRCKNLTKNRKSIWIINKIVTRHSIKPCGINKEKDLESHTNIHISSNCINAWAWCLLWTMIRWSQYSLSNLENWSLWVLPESGLILLNVRDSRKTQLTYIIFLSFASRVGWLSFRYVVVFDRLFGAICQIHLCAHFYENPVGTHKTNQLKQLNGTYWHTTFIVQTQTHILKKVQTWISHTGLGCVIGLRFRFSDYLHSRGAA